MQCPAKLQVWNIVGVRSCTCHIGLPIHYHVVLYIDQSAQKSADTKEIVTRWHQLHQGNIISSKFLDGDPLEPHETDSLNLLVHKWRERLASISWYMRVLNEKIATQPWRLWRNKVLSNFPHAPLANSVTLSAPPHNPLLQVHRQSSLQETLVQEYLNP